MRRLVGVAAAVVVTAAAGVLCLPGASAQAAPVEVLSLSFNMCGNKCNDGRLAVADHVADAVLGRANRPASAALQEVCAGQAQRVRSRLADAGYRVLHVPTARTCDDGSTYGIALAHRGEAAWWRVYDLPNPGGHEPRKMVCAMLTGPRMLACSTHIDFHADGTRGAQIREVAKVMAGFADAGHAAYVGGDFNAEPHDDQLDPMYRPAYGGGATGLHDEANGCCTRGGAGTGDGGRKIDYVFGLASAFTANWSDAVATSLSDHHKYWANLTLR